MSEVCFNCGGEVIWLSDGFDCPITDLCEECWNDEDALDEEMPEVR